jgi:hypothetical protein
MKRLIQKIKPLFIAEKVGLPQREKSDLEKRKEKVERIYQSALFECDVITRLRAWNLKARIEAEMLNRNSY